MCWKERPCLASSGLRLFMGLGFVQSSGRQGRGGGEPRGDEGVVTGGSWGRSRGLPRWRQAVEWQLVMSAPLGRGGHQGLAMLSVLSVPPGWAVPRAPRCLLGFTQTQDPSPVFPLPPDSGLSPPSRPPQGQARILSVCSERHRCQWLVSK